MSAALTASSAEKPLIIPSNKLGILEEDDEFEEFPVEDWDDGATANKIELSAAFTEDWDDQTVEDDFSNQLRAELKNLSSK